MALKKSIENEAFVRSSTQRIISHAESSRESKWLFDLRAILLNPAVFEHVSALFWESHGTTEIQIGGIETAGIPLVAGLVQSGYRDYGQAHVTGFFIRKSRKKEGLTKMIEGTIQKDVPIVLVDDLVNSGKSLMRQVEIIEALGLKVQAIWTLIRFRDVDAYQYFQKKGIAMHSVFTLDDFSDSLDVRMLTPETKSERYDAFEILWKFSAENPSYQYVVPKSDPAIDDERVYMGSDTGTMWAINQKDGSTAWSFQTGKHTAGKGIFSSPTVAAGVIYFGSYDGNIYALDAATGKKKWVAFEADWVGSSPCIAEELGLLFIGLEYGLWRKRGGIVALDLKTGRTKWRFNDMPCYTHSSPLYIKEHNQVVVGSNDGGAYLFDAKSGALIWKFETGVPTEDELNSGFCADDIKESFAYDAAVDRIIFGNIRGRLYAINRATGTEAASFSAEFGFYSTPLIDGDSIFATSVDKHLYCLDRETLEEKWRWNAGARIFSSPTLIEGAIFVGANTGRLTEIDPKNGREIGFLALTERITNQVAYNADTKHFFVPTFANELYCVKRTAS